MESMVGQASFPFHISQTIKPNFVGRSFKKIRNLDGAGFNLNFKKNEKCEMDIILRFLQ